jgi:hypothetical protein
MDVGRTSRAGIIMPSCNATSAPALSVTSIAALWEFGWEWRGAWLGRAPLLFWLIEVLQPHRIAIVGNDCQPAFLVACRAVERCGLPSTVFGAFTRPLPDEREQQANGCRVGTPHHLEADAARDLLTKDPVDLLVLDRSTAAIGSLNAPALWRLALSTPSVLVLDKSASVGPGWDAALRGFPGMTVGGADGLRVVFFDAEGESATSYNHLQLCLERLGEGLIARRGARDAQASAKRLKIALAEAAVRGDVASADLIAARQETLHLRDQLQASIAELQASAGKASAARQDANRLGKQLQTVTAEATKVGNELQAVSTRLGELKVQAAADNARAVDTEARLVAVLGSTSWRLTRPLRTALSRSPKFARLLRRAVKLIWWTVTFQLLARYRSRRQIRLESAFDSNAPSESLAPPPAFAPAALLESALERIAELECRAERVDTLERRVGCLDSVVEMERNRIDWALGGIEGVITAIDSYHAYRETSEYYAAFAAATPLVSVCVSTMDRVDILLERSIASLLSQSYRNIQIVVVGDNCTDDTARRLAAIHDNRIQFSNLSERGPYPSPGPDRWRVAGSNAVNHALTLCEGQFVTHLDDDDLMVPHRIENLVAAALKAQSDFLWHAFWAEAGDGTWFRLGNGRLELGQVTTSSIFYHRYFARFPWDVRAYRLGEPGDWNRLRKIKLLRPRLFYVDEPLVYHHAEQSQAPFVPRDGEQFLK